MKRKTTTQHPLQTYYSRIYKTYDLVNRLFTFGLDRKWRRITVRECLKARPSRILDLCCGTGDLAVAVCKEATYPIQVIGYDLNEKMLDMARAKALHEQVEIKYIQGDAGSMPFSREEFDCITIGFGFRNLTWENPYRDKYMAEISRILKPGAKLLILESARPENRLIAFFYTLYLKLVLVPLGGLLSGNLQAYKYLAGSSAGFYNFDALRALLAIHHFDMQLNKKFLFGSVNLLVATRTAT